MPRITFHALLVALICSTLIFSVAKNQVSLKADAGIPSSFAVSDVYRVAQITGEGSVNDTASRNNLLGTDLGIAWDDGQGQVMVAFGDTYGAGWSGCGAG